MGYYMEANQKTFMRWDSQKIPIKGIESIFIEERPSLIDRPGYQNLVASMESEGMWFPLSCIRLPEDWDSFKFTFNRKETSTRKYPSQSHVLSKLQNKLKSYVLRVNREVDTTLPLLWTGSQRYRIMKNLGVTHTDVIIVEWEDIQELHIIEREMMKPTNHRFT